MTNDTPLLLSQQVLAWLFRALGLTDYLTHVSEGTLKNARKGKVIDRTWDGLVAELLRLAGAPPEGRDALAAHLRAIDEGIGRIETDGLDDAGRVTAMALTFAPLLAVRAGALSAAIQRLPGASSKPKMSERWAECAREPLSPFVFRRVVDGLFDWLAPEVDLSSQRALECDVAMGLGNRPYERWGTEKVHVPKPGSIDKLVAYFGPRSDGADDAIELVLRLARASLQLQKDVEKYVDAEMAEALRMLTHTTADRASTMLTAKTSDQELGSWAAQVLRGASGNAAFPLFRACGFDSAADSPAEAADRLERMNVEPHERDWLIRLQVIAPLPQVTAAAYAMAEVMPGHLALVHTWRDQLHGNIETARLLRAFLEADWPDTTIHLKDREPITAAGLAREVYERFDLRSRVMADWRPFHNEVVVLLQVLTSHAGGPQAGRAVLQQLAMAEQAAHLPADAERVWEAAGGDPGDLPRHMLAARARRLLSEGDLEGGIAHVKRWTALRKAEGREEVVSQQERHTLAEALIAAGHTAVDRAWAAHEEHGDDEDLGVFATLFMGHASLAAKCFRLGYRLYAPNVAAHERILQTLHAMPLGLRVAYLYDCMDREMEGIEPLEALVDGAHELTELHRQNADAWVCLAIAQRECAEDPSATDKRVRHLGGEARLNAELQRFDRDAGFAPE